MKPVKIHLPPLNLSFLLARYGGWRGLVQKTIFILRGHGLRSVPDRVKSVIKQWRLSLEYTDSRTDAAKALRIIPYYLVSHTSVAPIYIPVPDIGIHLHLHYPDMLEECIAYLKRVPFPFSLYVSLQDTAVEQSVIQTIQQYLPAVQRLEVRAVPNRGRDIAPFIVEFGKALQQHQIIAHLHTKKSLHNSALANWFQEIMSALFGSSEQITQIIQLLQTDAKFVYPASNASVLIGKNGWGENYETAQRVAKKFFHLKINQFPSVEFPQGTMFWATTAALRKFLNLPLKYSDFPAEPIRPDGTLAHALERLLLISASQLPGYNYCLYQPDTIIQEPAYEEAHDYSAQNRHPTVKVLSYYLPQFYPTPENDKWHGKDFTEWYKVRDVNALFYGHYQQRVPHADAGYYTLANLDILRKQAVWMKQAGVHGQVFYHYWFSGKLILEKPAQMLLADASIEIPFCFCWANENWTRRWDGNEQEILLQQNYSAQDAEDFIRYLIPFFRDSRYIHVENRPALFIYRPSSIPDFSIYQQVWARVCAEHGIPEPYVIAVLTRGATSPRSFGMQAGVERVLHDWTDGNVRDIRYTLAAYRPLNGSVLDYNEVADYYMAQDLRQDFTYFRSIIPSWDNSPRYASEAFIIHNSSPQKFQEWLQALIQDTETRLPADRRFILVNAWNEWAESAVLDPDQRFGYAYLNSIGRALADMEYNQRAYLQSTLPPDLRVGIFLTPELLKVLDKNEYTRIKMLTCLANSSLLQACRVSISQPQLRDWLVPLLPDTTRLETTAPDKNVYIIHINEACYFAPPTLEVMAKMAHYDDAGVVLPSIRNNPHFTHYHLGVRWEAQDFDTLRLPPLFLYKIGAKRNQKYCVDANIFNAVCEPSPGARTPVVSSIIRFHSAGDIMLLQNALYSLLAQAGCIVQPVIAVQDLSDEQIKQLQSMLAQMPWHAQHLPIIRKYHAAGNQVDLRATMLNESLKSIVTPYAAFLDYDDILFPNAYVWLLRRLQKSGKNAAFGLIYTTKFSVKENRIRNRYVVYNYGKTYADFLERNHTPIHGFMLNLQKVDLQHITYVPGMRYQEDYYLLLQILSAEGADWHSLRLQEFIGDYYHYEDKLQTLGILGSERAQVLESPEFRAAEEEIEALRRRLRSKG